MLFKEVAWWNKKGGRIFGTETSRDEGAEFVAGTKEQKESYPERSVKDEILMVI